MVLCPTSLDKVNPDYQINGKFVFIALSVVPQALLIEDGQSG
jgi:hypothetical protein